MWSHSSTTVDPLSNGGLLPGRAYMDAHKADKVSPSCVRMKPVGGGVIGYRPMLAQDHIRAEVDAWRMGVEDAVSDGRAPEALARTAREIEEIFFNEFVFYDVDDTSLFYVAPGIWIQQDAKVCADGTVVIN